MSAYSKARMYLVFNYVVNRVLPFSCCCSNYNHLKTGVDGMD